MDDYSVPLCAQSSKDKDEAYMQPVVTSVIGTAPVVTPPVVLNNGSLILGPQNTCTTCPFCYATVKTSIKYTTTSRTHIIGALLCPLCCCCIPHCTDATKNTDHYCPNCKKYLGTYQK